MSEFLDDPPVTRWIEIDGRRLDIPSGAQVAWTCRGYVIAHPDQPAKLMTLAGDVETVGSESSGQ